MAGIWMLGIPGWHGITSCLVSAGHVDGAAEHGLFCPSVAPISAPESFSHMGHLCQFPVFPK